MPDVFGRRTGDPENRTVAWKLIDTDPATGADVWAEIVALEPASIGGGGGGGLTDAQLRAADVKITLDGETVPVTGTFWQATQPVSGTLALDAGTLAALETISVANFPATQAVTGTFWQATQPVSGPLTDAQLRAAVVPVDVTPAAPAAGDYLPVRLTDGTAFYVAGGGSGGGGDGAILDGVSSAIKATVTAANALKVDGSAVTQPVSGTFWQATQPVSGPLTDAQLRAASVAISDGGGSLTVDGTFWQATQPVSGPLTDAQLRAVAVPVSGTFWQATQPVSIAASVNVEGDTAIDAPVVNNPVNTGGRGSDTVPAKVSADGDLTHNWQDNRGATIMRDRVDMGRTRVIIKFHGAAPATADTLLSVVKQANGVDAAGATSIGVTANKKLRLTGGYVGVRATAAAAAFCEVTFRTNPAGATVIGSPSWLRVPVGVTGAVIGSAMGEEFDFGEGGIEFDGAHTIGISASAQATTNQLSITLYGYEYDN